MKKLILSVFTILAFHFSFATTIYATQNNGVWKTATTWNKNRKPQDGDTVVIPAAKTIVVSDWQTLNNVTIKVFGTLKFINVLSALDLNTNSSVEVYSGASIQATINYLQYITIGSATVFMAGQLNGPKLANATTGSNFISFSPLPVKFVGFTVAVKNNDVLIQWSTSQEINADIYEVERSTDGSNWGTIAYVAATGNSSDVNSYSYTDKNISPKTVYYRVKEIDLDGQFAYTSVKSIKTETAAQPDIRIAGIQKKVLLQFSEEIKGNLIVRFVSLSGQVVDQQAINNPIGQVVLNSKVTGNYIISVSNGQQLNIAKQIIL